MAGQSMRYYDPGSRSTSQEKRNERLVNGLGWFSIGLGVAEIVAPRKVARLIGARDEGGTRSLLRFYGLREIAAGVGILTQPRPAGWLWGRVGGDLLDLASLGAAMNSDRSDKSKVGTATATVIGITALDIYCAQKLSVGNGLAETEEQPKLVSSVTVNRPAEELYNHWHDFKNLPVFMDHLESVEMTGGGRSHWRTKGLMGRTIEWEAETTEDQPGRRIAWRSVEPSDVHHSGSVNFEPATGGRGTVVKLEVEYRPLGGALTAQLAKLLGKDPLNQMERELRQFKQIMETGEIVKSDASIHTGMHPAQPPAR